MATRLSIRASREELDRWHIAAKAEGRDLADFVRVRLDAPTDVKKWDYLDETAQIVHAPKGVDNG